MSNAITARRATEKATQELLGRLNRAIEVNERPPLSSVRRAIAEIERLLRVEQELRQELAAVKREKDNARPAADPTDGDQLRVRLWNKFQPIPGSRYRRVWCYRCGAPMRASLDMCAAIMTGRARLECEKCDPPLLYPRELFIAPRQRAKLGKTSS